MSDFQYTRQDLINLNSAFSEYIDNPGYTPAQDFLVGQGIKRYLEERMNVCRDYLENKTIAEPFVCVPEDIHFYILDFVEGLILDLEQRIRESEDDTYWREEYRCWLKCMKDAYNQLEEKEPV